jgi:hypothetical protein
MRGMFENGGYLGASAAMYELWSRGLLRLLEEQACDQTLPQNEAPDYQIIRARRRLGMVLRRRNRAGIGLKTPLFCRLVKFGVVDRDVLLNFGEAIRERVVGSLAADS